MFGTAMEHVQIVAESVLKIEPEDMKDKIEETCEVDEEEEDEVKPAFAIVLHPVKKEEELLLEDPFGGPLLYEHGKSSADVKHEISSSGVATEIKEESDKETWRASVAAAAPAPVLSSTPSPPSSLPLSSSPLRRPRLLQCETCDAAFAKKGHLNRHLRIHTGERPYLCDVCGSGFSERTPLVMHRRTHTDERPYDCADCGATFRRRKTLAEHVRIHMRQRGQLVGPERTHRQERSYGCDTCGARFSLKSTLRIHLRTHTGERPFGCEECGAHFTGLDILRKHIRKHTGERLFLCDVCGASFSRRDCIIAHMRLHTHGGKRDWKLRCGACGLYVKNGARLAKHQRTHAPAPGTRQMSSQNP